MTISSIPNVDRTTAMIQASQPALQGDATSQAASTSASPVQKPYFYSPALAVDSKTGRVVIEIRDAETGSVVNQYPSKKDLEAYARNAQTPEEPKIAVTTESNAAAAPIPVAATANAGAADRSAAAAVGIASTFDAASPDTGQAFQAQATSIIA